MTFENRRLTPGTILKLALIGAILLVGIPMTGSVMEHLDATEVMVIQSPFSGNLAWYTTPGWKPQWFGKVTKYHKRSQFEFFAPKEKDQPDNSIKVRFNDGGHAQLSGSIAWEIPTDEKSLSTLHSKYGSQQSVDNQLVRTVLEKAVYMTGPLMSSKESYAERRADLIRLIEDQVDNGVFQTNTEQVKEHDPLTGLQKTVSVVKLVEKDGVIQRQDSSPLKEFAIRTFNLSLNSIDYDDTVDKQIQVQQQAVMEVQTAMAQAKKAEQAAITAAETGKAHAAEAKWKQEAIKAQMVTEAEQRLAVAELDRKTAEQRKLENIARGQGEAEARRLVMSADNALQARLDAYIKVNERYAQALENIKVPIVPGVVMGNGTGNSGRTGAQDLIDLATAKFSRDLGAEISVNTKADVALAKK